MTEKKDEKGHIVADVSDDAIREALASVERRKPVLSPAEGTGDGDQEAAPAEADAEIKEDLEKAQASLEDSQRRSRELMDKIKDTHERMLRAVADLDNFKKRANKEKDDIQKFGTEKLIKEILPVADNLDRALEASKTTRDVEVLVAGVQLTTKLLETVLGKFGVEGHSSVGKPFDPNLMEAMMQQETNDVPANTVVSELAKGYTIHGRLVRPAAVVVSRPKQDTAPAPVPAEPADPGGGSVP